jgi:dCMP deaminase
MDRKERKLYWNKVCEDYKVDDMDKYIKNIKNIERPVVDISKIIINDIFSPRVIKDDDEKLEKLVVRPTWDEYFKEIVQVTSRRSPCERLQVGCLLVKDNRIISQGYNGFLPGCPHKSIVRNNHEQATLHAEQNALMDCAKRGASCKGATAYITHYPCIICCRLLLAADIGEIKYIADYKNDELVKVFTNQCNVCVTKI